MVRNRGERNGSEYNVLITEEGELKAEYKD